RAGQTLTAAARAVGGVWACVEGVLPETCDSDFGRIVCGLGTALKHPEVAVRREAAALMRQAFAAIKGTLLEATPTLPDEPEQAVPALLAATADTDPEVRRAVLAALRIAAPHTKPSAVVDALVKNTLRARQPVVVAESLAVLQGAGVDAAS